jgi:endonuclease V-like protein UPF0215 family
MPLSHVIGFDDGPFDRRRGGDVVVIGAVYARARLDGVLSGKVRRDGVNSTRTLARLVSASRYFAQIHAILIQGIAFAGFNVIDIHGLSETLRIPVVVVARRRPDLDAMRRALLNYIPGGARKWALIERAGPMEPMAGLYVQRAGLSPTEAKALLERFAFNSIVPEPLRAAHLIAGAIVTGHSTGRV